MEFGLPLTGLEKLEETIGLPDFSGPMADEDYIVNQQTHFHEHFASQIVLRRLSVNFHSVLNKSTSKEQCTGSLSNRTLMPYSLWHRCFSTLCRVRSLQHLFEPWERSCYETTRRTIRPVAGHVTQSSKMAG
jgi:hypothetical protein